MMNSIIKDKKELIEALAGEFDLDVVEIRPWHLRISNINADKIVDYFPKSGRATWLKSQKWFTIDDIETFILQNFS